MSVKNVIPRRPNELLSWDLTSVKLIDGKKNGYLLREQICFGGVKINQQFLDSPLYVAFAFLLQ